MLLIFLFFNFSRPHGLESNALLAGRPGFDITNRKFVLCLMGHFTDVIVLDHKWEDFLVMMFHCSFMVGICGVNKQTPTQPFLLFAMIFLAGIFACTKRKLQGYWSDLGMMQAPNDV